MDRPSGAAGPQLRPIELTAPAKINLALHVTGRRADSYHLIESLVVFAEFGDLLRIEATDRDALAVSGPFAEGVPADGRNLVVAARERLRAAAGHGVPELTPTPDPSPQGGGGHLGSTAPSDASTVMAETVPASPSPLWGGVRGGGMGRSALLAGHQNGTTKPADSATPQALVPPVLLRLEKHLPAASGIGGGSSDAAAALHGLNRFWGLGLAPETLAEVGRTLGADVPMCLAGKPLVARGIGDILEPVAAFPRLPLLLVNPGVPVSTPAVFAALASRDNPPLPALPAQLDLAALLGWLANTRNDLEEPATQLAPPISDARAALRAAGAAFARMSGSGATCFGLFASASEADAAAADIRRRQPGWFVTSTMVGQQECPA